MAHLFSKLIITDALRNLEIPDIEGKISIIRDWLDMYNSGGLQKKSEKEFEGVYNESLFGSILGYTSASNGRYTREKEPRNESNGQKCDIGLGFYASESSITHAVVELKDAATSLDRPQQRAGNLTPVQQAFKYKPLYNSKWVIVSNFFEIRLYTDTYKDYESFTLKELVDSKDNYANFRKFYLLFHAENLIAKDTESKTEGLLAKVRIEEEKISKEFYKEYKSLRLELMRDIWQNNPEMRNADVIEKAQLIIDRIVFICFCEDRGLLPQNKLQENILRAKEIDLSPWETLKIFFGSVDKGSEKLGIPDGYNGGLFRENPEIDSLKISDGVIEKFINLGRYDFSEDGGQLSVEILGHIFEQSISDIEEIRTQIENQGKVEEEKSTEKKVSKRKKDGIFYTPAYIVDYIVENSLGKYMSEHEEAMKEKYKLKEDILEKNYRKREIEAYTEYQKILQNVKVLDPACGSGAFLVRVFDWLKEENIRVDRIINGENTTISMMETDANAFYAEILRNNIYGVDLNEESVEITKLSLWLKSAVRGKKLVTLDANIKCGNSLIDDPAVAGDKAFDWNKEFADIMANGGFDVIVGNPPYVFLRSDNMLEAEKTFYRSKYELYKLKPRTDIYFFERAYGLLKRNGFLGFIAPNNILTVNSLSNFRYYTLRNFSLINFVNIRGAIFVDASVDTMIACMQKNDKKDEVIVHESANGYFNKLCVIDKNQLLQGDAIINYEMFLNQNIFPLIQKIELNTKTLEECVSVSNGVVAYKKGNGNPSQTEEMGVQRIYHSYDKKDSNWLPYIDGSDARRYQVNWSGLYIKYGNNLGEPRTKELFSDNHLIVRVIPSKPPYCINCVSIERDIINDQNYIVLYESDKDFELSYILAILNSRITSFWFVNKFGKMQRGLFPQLKAGELRSFPIPKTSLSEQQPFIKRADLMLALNRELHDKSDAFLKNIFAKYKIEKVTRKLEKWWELEFAEFVQKLKVKLSFEEQEELMSYFDKRKREVRNIVAHIEATDKEIDEMVFELYGLTEEERRVVLESN